MIVRGVDINGDWNFGRGQSDYVRDRSAVAQDIKTRLKSFIGDCFFDITAGIDWLNLLGGKDKTGIDLAVTAIILNTQNVTGVSQISSLIDAKRKISITYEVQTTFGPVADTFQLDTGQV